MDAIKVSAVDYLIKPINLEEFVAAIQKAMVNLSRQSNRIKDNVENSYQEKSQSKLSDGRLSIPSKNEMFIFVCINSTIFSIYNVVCCVYIL